MTSKTVLIVTAHTDDECFCTGLIQKFIKIEYNVNIACMSPAIESIPREFSKIDTEIEFYKNCQYNLKLKTENIFLYEYPVRYFFENQQSITERLYVLNKNLKPEIVVFPSVNDCHQDHNIVARACQRIFKHSDQYGIEFPRNNYNFNPVMYCKLTDDEMKIKLKAFSIYESQMAKRENNYLKEVETIFRFRGSQIGVEFAECYEVYRICF